MRVPLKLVSGLAMLEATEMYRYFLDFACADHEQLPDTGDSRVEPKHFRPAIRQFAADGVEEILGRAADLSKTLGR
jgi:hypothetical protein